jgi:hypothetical protein
MLPDEAARDTHVVIELSPIDDAGRLCDGAFVVFLSEN